MEENNDDELVDMSRNILSNLDTNRAVPVLSSKERFQQSVINLVETQMHKAQNYDDIIDNAVSRLNERITSNELDINELMEVISLLSTKKLDVIHTVFAPLQNSQKSIFDGNTDNSDFEKGLKDLSPEQLKVFDKILRVVKSGDGI